MRNKKFSEMDEDTKKVLRAIILLQPQVPNIQSETGLSDDKIVDAIMELIENGRAKIMKYPDGTFRLRIIGGLRGFKLRLIKNQKPA